MPNKTCKTCEHSALNGCFSRHCTDCVMSDKDGIITVSGKTHCKCVAIRAALDDNADCPYYTEYDPTNQY